MIVIRYIPQDSYSVLFLGAKSSAQHMEFEGIVRVVFASVAMGMGIDLKGVDTIIHYGAPSSIEDYFQASGKGG